MPGAAVVIGAGPGLGLALIRRFAAEGLAVGFIARRAETVAEFQKQLDAEGRTSFGLVADAADPEALRTALDSFEARHGAPELAVYNAAIIEPSRLVTPSGIAEARYADAPGWQARGAPLDEAALVAGFRANVVGALTMAQQVAPGMMERGRGTILLTGGVLAFGPWIEWAGVSLGKAALRSLGHSLALELAPQGVQVTTVAIHGTMAPGTPYDPAIVAKTYWDLHLRPASDWAPDFHVKIDAEDGSDPDR